MHPYTLNRSLTPAACPLAQHSVLGYSIADDDQFGEPGSFPRNPYIAAVFREMRFPENKGTGIAAVCRAMQQAGLTPPLFDPDRAKNRFVTTLWIHNLIGDEDATWLAAVGTNRLNDAQAKALVLARRTGWVSNAVLRDLTGLDTLGASIQLKKLREMGLLEPKGRGSATHYVLSDLGRNAGAVQLGGPTSEQYATAELAKEHRSTDEERDGTEQPGPGQDRPDLGSDRPEFNPDRPDLPDDLKTAIKALGSRLRQGHLRNAIEQRCRWRPLRAAKLGSLLGIRPDNLAKRPPCR